MKIEISKFKKIEHASLELDSINIFIGTNNSGKSSFIQGIQFAISACQTLQLQQANWRRVDESRTSNLESYDFLYTPTRHIEDLYHGSKLTGARRRADRKNIEFVIENNEGRSSIEISRGKNGGFTTVVTGRILGEVLSNVQKPFCVYVPGIAGIPVQEKYEVPIAVKKSATRGDSNNYLRNIILEISNNEEKWYRFNSSINSIYPNTEVGVQFEKDESEYIIVNVKSGELALPIDSVGTGLLQVIQVFAYIEYFDPKLILLDEPDAHIHPTKQKLLALEMAKRTTENADLKVVFSTHSRYILDALERKAKVFNFQNGKAISDVLGSKILVDIGAADADYLFSKKNLKYIIATEDKVDNVEEKKEFLKKFLIANGLSEDEFVLHSYEGCKKVHFAKILKDFINKQIPTAEVILHIDRDQRVDSDRELEKLRADCLRDGISLFITEFSEVENYFCQPEHIHKSYGISLNEAQAIYEMHLSDLKERTKEKISNFILQERPELALGDSNRPDIRIINRQVDEWYESHADQFTPGKELLGRIKSHIQKELKLPPNNILNVSPVLFRQAFQDVIYPIAEEKEEVA